MVRSQGAVVNVERAVSAGDRCSYVKGNEELKRKMAICKGCDTEIDVDEFDVDLGDQLSCPECGALLLVTGLLPLEIDLEGDDQETDSSESTGDEVDDDG